ncbi:MAG: type II 3-dehydroquinate dehydratase [Deltaproteobacteria bacterium]|nr:type II 3-dehydroquinate dehydratase [Deltaproteobacteria bacterium]
MRVEVIHGPNLNLLGSRQPEIYGSESLEEINASLVALGRTLDVDVRCHQSNHEGALIDLVQQAGRESDFLIINPGGFTHTSIALRDAIIACGLPAIEVHLSNLHAREPERQVTRIGGVVRGRIEGLGAEGYRLALRYAAALAGEKKS